MRQKILGLLLLSVMQLHCSPAPPSMTKVEDDEWARRAWLDKAKQALLLGARVSSEEDAQLLSLPRGEIVDALMAKPEFANRVLDFNLYFLGRRLEKLVDNEGLLEAASDSSSALNSAVELAQGGDYFTLFNWSQTYSSVQDFKANDIETTGAPSSLNTLEGLRSFWIDQAVKDVADIEELISTPAGTQKACELIANENRTSHFNNQLLKAALPTNLHRIMRLNFKISAHCGSLGITFPLNASFRVVMQRELSTLHQNLRLLPTLLRNLPPTRAKNVRDLIILPYDKLSPETTVLDKAFDDRLWEQLPNFSTNFNRRRAAYVLKTYFCDDLTPLNIVAANSHASSKHASEESCAACHYKLDPMAGFFKSRGIFGTEFSDEHDFSALVHDDFASRENSELTEYINEWRSPAGSAREWNVGYIRSATNAKLNSYGESMDDLFAIIRAARESKVCLTRRMAEYVLGSEQVYDGAWIDSLAQDLHKAASDPNPGASSLAFKKVYKALILSETFRQPAIEANQCYDFAPKANNTGLPCAVASIVQKNCSSCHSGEDASGGLDLSRWEGGQFRHLNFEDGKALGKTESFQRIKDRISSSDPELQMPLMKTMDAVERANFFKWISQEMAGVTP